MVEPTAEQRRRTLGLVGGMFVLLAIQNLAGIWLNLYVAVHDTASYGGVYAAMFASDAGVVHTVVGLLIGGNAILAVVQTWRWSDRRPRAVATVSLLLVALAAYLGFHFVSDGGADVYSLGMEVAFMGIVLCQAALLFFVGAGPGARTSAATAAPT